MSTARERREWEDSYRDRDTAKFARLADDNAHQARKRVSADAPSAMKSDASCWSIRPTNPTGTSPAVWSKRTNHPAMPSGAS